MNTFLVTLKELESEPSQVIWKGFTASNVFDLVKKTFDKKDWKEVEWVKISASTS